LVAAITRTSAYWIFADPSCLYSFSWRNRRKLGLGSEGEAVDFVEKEGAALALAD